MPLIANSSSTVNPATPGAWFSVTGNGFVADVDGPAAVYLETRRDNNDAAPKPLFDGAGGGRGFRNLVGPCSVYIVCTAGRQYRFVGASGSATCAATE